MFQETSEEEEVDNGEAVMIAKRRLRRLHVSEIFNVISQDSMLQNCFESPFNKMVRWRVLIMTKRRYKMRYMFSLLKERSRLCDLWNCGDAGIKALIC